MLDETTATTATEVKSELDEISVPYNYPQTTFSVLDEHTGIQYLMAVDIMPYGIHVFLVQPDKPDFTSPSVIVAVDDDSLVVEHFSGFREDGEIPDVYTLALSPHDKATNVVSD